MRGRHREAAAGVIGGVLVEGIPSRVPTQTIRLYRHHAIPLIVFDAFGIVRRVVLRLAIAHESVFVPPGVWVGVTIDTRRVELVSPLQLPAIRAIMSPPPRLEGSRMRQRLRTRQRLLNGPTRRALWHGQCGGVGTEGCSISAVCAQHSCAPHGPVGAREAPGRGKSLFWLRRAVWLFMFTMSRGYKTKAGKSLEPEPADSD